MLRYITRVEVVLDGQNMPPQRVWHTDVYERRDGEWRAVWSQATRILGQS